MKITEKGQVTIPAKVRKQTGLLPHTDVEFVADGGQVVIRKARRKNRRGERLIRAMAGKATAGLSTDEIMALTRGD